MAAIANLLPVSITTFCSKSKPIKSKYGTNNIYLTPRRCRIIKYIACNEERPIIRRSANYQASIWDNNYIQSLTSEYLGESHVERANKLKGNVKMLLMDNTLETLQQLEMIDTLQRLGLSYHFKHDIKRIINTIFNNIAASEVLSLYAAALQFRILRQHGYHINQDFFLRFQDDTGKFEERRLSYDIKGILYLYEASFLMVRGENIMEDAREFASKHLKLFVNKAIKHEDIILYELVSHTLELPLHWRMLRLEARWFIDIYEKKLDMNPIVLEFAKLDFNMVQAIHQSDLQYSSRWWKFTVVGERLRFARDRIMENFLWSVGMSFEPEFGLYRRMETKVHALLTALDDVYDVYGSLDELELFTSTIESWDINAAEKLPQYMKIPFMALYNSMNEVVFKALKEQDLFVLPCLKKAVADLFRCYLVEAKWFYNGYKPTMEEYMNIAWISITAPVMLVHTYLVTSSSGSLNNEVLEDLALYPNILRYSSMIVRYTDDLGTSSDELKRGDNPKAIQCYMNDTGASEEKAREHIRDLISEMWTKINEEHLSGCNLSPVFIEIAINLARTTQCMYLYGDGHASQDCATKHRLESLFINPIS